MRLDEDIRETMNQPKTDAELVEGQESTYTTSDAYLIQDDELGPAEEVSLIFLTLLDRCSLNVVALT